MIIYKITHGVSGRVYIGQHVGDSVQVRWGQHVADARRGSELYLHRAIRKYGVKAFEAKILYAAKTFHELSKMETFFIILHQSHKPENGYNMTMGGESTYGLKWTTEQKENHCLIMKNRPIPEGSLLGLLKGLQTQKERLVSSSYRMWKSAPMHTPEAKAARVQAQTGVKQRPEVAEARAARHRGRTRPAEARQNMSAGWTPEIRANASQCQKQTTVCDHCGKGFNAGNLKRHLDGLQRTRAAKAGA